MKKERVCCRSVYQLSPVALGVALSFCTLSLALPLFAEEINQTDKIQPETVDSSSRALTFKDLLHLAVFDNPAMDMADARVEQANQLVNQNGSFRFPKVEASATVGPEHNDPAPSDAGHALTNGRNLKLTLTQLLYDGRSSRSEYERSQKLAEAAAAEARIELEDVFLAVVVAYIDYWRYQREWGQAKIFVSTMEDLVNDLGSMYNAGAASKIEVDFAKARLASARATTSAAQASMNNALSELEFLVPGIEPFDAQSPEEFHELQLEPLATYFAQGALDNSEFITNRLSMEATTLRVQAQKGRYKPSLDFEISGSLIDDEGGPSELRGKGAAKLLLNYTLFSGGERKAGVKRAQAQLSELEAERAQLEREVFRRIDQSYNAVNASRITLDAVTDEIAANQELQRLNRKNLSLGTINIIELIDVEERLYNAQARRNEVIATMHQEYFGLVIAGGYSTKAMASFNIEMPSR